MREVFGIMLEELNGYLATLQRIWERELAYVNRALEGLRLEPLDPWDETTKLEFFCALERLEYHDVT
jgi:hypothetical protein